MSTVIPIDQQDKAEPTAQQMSLLVDLFHRINRIIPQDQEILTFPPELTCNEAITQMRRTGYSQVPVVSDGEVLGVFSYRSFAHNAGTVTLRELNQSQQAPGEMQVVECLDKFEYTRVTEEMTKVFDAMDKDLGILVGTPEKLVGILTPMDVLRYLHGIAQPFVLLSEIEHALRSLIGLAVTNEQLCICAKQALKDLYDGDDTKVPTQLERMTFDNYRLLVVRGENWPLFEATFGGSRARADGKMKAIGELRNDVFHFKRLITTDDVEVLTTHRDWLLTKAKQADQRSRTTQSTGTNGK